MAQRQKIAAVYTAAMIQGIVLVTFPAVSAMFTSAAHYGLSTTEYGGMFVRNRMVYSPDKYPFTSDQCPIVNVEPVGNLVWID